LRHPMTKIQKETYDFVCKFWQVEGRNPTLAEMQKGRIRDEQISPERASRTSPYRAVQALVRLGYLESVNAREKGNVTYWRPAPEDA
jgi:hypothetical protein